MIVVDASVAVKWVLSETGSEEAVALRDQDLMAPVLWLAEAANVLWRRARIGEITGEQANARLSELLKAPVASLPIEPHLERALGLAIEIGHPIYDCIYLALALHHQTHVVTADQRFASAANVPELTDHVRLLSTSRTEPSG
jgi:predicted nucleic acid-binding protein